MLPLDVLEEMLEENCNKKYLNTWYEQVFNKGVCGRQKYKYETIN